MTPEDHARRAYEAYGATTDWKNFQGGPMPAFGDLGDTIRLAWIRAANVARETGYGLFRCLDHCDHEFVTQLDRVEHKLDALLKGVSTMGEAIDNELTVLEGGQTLIESKLDALSADEQRELADLEAKDTLTADEQARFDALAARQAATAAAIQADTDAIDAADPATPPVEPAPEGDGGETTPPEGDGSTDGTEPVAGE